MPDDKQKGVVEIANEPAAGAEPAHVSIFVDGDRRYTVRTNDLATIGAQLRGKKSFSIFYGIVIPALAVFISTGIAQVFQYISWRNSTQLQQTTERVALAKTAYRQASDAISERYYASVRYLDAALALNGKTDLSDPLHTVDLKFNQKSFDDYNEQMKKWTDSYDQILSDIDFNMDRPMLWFSERVSKRKFRKMQCGSDVSLLSEFQRLKLNINSLKLQFAAIDYCFHQAMLPFDIEKKRAIAEAGYIIPPTERKAAAQRIEDVRSMSNEFRCFAQHRIALFDRDKRLAIFKLSRWIGQQLSAVFGDARKAARDDLAKRLARAVEECDFTKAVKRRGRFAS